jgi:hypothetical protein
MQPEWTTIRDELLTMADHDLRVRAELAADGSLYDNYNARMQAVHDANAMRLVRFSTRTAGLANIRWVGKLRRRHGLSCSTRLLNLHFSAAPSSSCTKQCSRVRLLAFTQLCWRIGYAAWKAGPSATGPSSTGISMAT